MTLRPLNGAQVVALYLSVIMLLLCPAVAGCFDFVLKELGWLKPAQQDGAKDTEDYEPPDASPMKSAPLEASLALSLPGAFPAVRAAQRVMETGTKTTAAPLGATRKCQQLSAVNVVRSAASHINIAPNPVVKFARGHPNTPARAPSHKRALSGTPTRSQHDKLAAAAGPRVTWDNLFEYSVTLQSPNATAVTLRRQLDVIVAAGYRAEKDVLPQPPPSYGRDWVKETEELKLFGRIEEVREVKSDE
ncbi:hypothetical protein H2203_001945 [Taxawa tesnikishii (nom. ined.)]|nr:hypothetical protein H2203_001945 [Dothideales sp. JES 119]